MEGALVWLAYSRAPGVGRVRLARLIATCPDPADAWRLSAAELAGVDKWNRRAAEAAVAVRRNSDALRQAEEEWERSQRAGLRLITLLAPDYPWRLQGTPEPPPYFYQAGPWSPDARPVVAIVGTRRPTAYGVSVAERFGRRLAELGVIIVSGMARGIDCAAHRGALAAGGTTVAVLGGGADVCYPPEAASIYRRIRATGAVISEQPPGTKPQSEFFPERNRIISGLADGVLVVESGEHSGTSITVDTALEQGRDVFAIPGPITSPMSVGPNKWIKTGAHPVTSPEELLELLSFRAAARTEPWALGGGAAARGSVAPDGSAAPTAPAAPHGLSAEERRVLSWVGERPCWAGDLTDGCGLSAGEVQGILTLLELKGLIRQVPGGQYIRIG